MNWQIIYKKTCENCGEENFFDKTSNCVEEWWSIVIDLEHIWQKDFWCEKCNAHNYCWELEWLCDS